MPVPPQYVITLGTALPLVSVASVNNVLSYGATPDGITVSDGAISAVTNTKLLSSATAGFLATDVGKLITVQGAGAAGAPLAGTIASYVSPTQVTLSVAASTTVTNAIVDFGTDNLAAINAAIAAVSVPTNVRTGAVGNNYSLRVYLPTGLYMVSAGFTIGGAPSSVIPAAGIVFEGDGQQQQGAGGTIIKLASVQDFLVTVQTAYAKIRSIHFHGNNLANKVVQLLYLSSSNTYEYLNISNAVSQTGSLVYIMNGTPTTEEVDFSKFTRCNIMQSFVAEGSDQAGYGFNLVNNSEAFEITVEYTNVSDCNYLVRMISGGISFYHCSWFRAAIAYCSYEACQPFVLHDVYSETSGSFGVWLQETHTAGVSGTGVVTVDHCIINNQALPAISLQCKQPVVFRDCQIGCDISVVPATTWGLYRVTMYNCAIIGASKILAGAAYIDQYDTLYNSLSLGGLVITSATNATPIVCTTASAHNYTTGQQVQNIGALGNTAVNGLWTVTVTSPTVFSLDTSVGNGAYTASSAVTSDAAGTLPRFLTGQITATSATAGTHGDVPAQVVGYLTWNVNGNVVKIPYYNP